MKAAKDQLIDPQYIAEELKAIPNAIQTLESMSASQRKTVLSKMARQIKAKMVQQQANQDLTQQQASAQPEEDQMEMGPETTEGSENVSTEMPMAQYGMNMNNKLYKFINGGDIENYPAAAELPDSDIYRTFPPNFPRLFKNGGLTKFQGVVGSGEFRVPNLNYIPVRDTTADMAIRSGVDPATAYGGTDVESDFINKYVAKPLVAGAAGAAAAKYGPQAIDYLSDYVRRASNLTSEAWKKLSKTQQTKKILKAAIKNPVVLGFGTALATLAHEYFADDTDVVVNTPKALPKGANNQIPMDSLLISPINPDSVPSPDSTLFQGMPQFVGQSFDIDTTTQYKKKKKMGGVNNQGPMNYGAFPIVMSEGGPLPNELKPDNVIDNNKEIFKTYLSDNMKRDRLKKLLESNNLMDRMVLEKKKLKTYQGNIDTGNVKAGSAPWNISSGSGYKVPYETYEPDDITGQGPSYNFTNYPLPIGPNTEQGNFYSEYDTQGGMPEDYPSGSFPEKFDRPDLGSRKAQPSFGQDTPPRDSRWKGMSGIQKAEGVLSFLFGANSGMERRRAKEEEEYQQRFMTPEAWSPSAPTSKGEYLVNSGDFVPPNMQTPVQFTGYNPGVFAKKGSEINSKITYLTNDQIRSIIEMGGQVEFLD
jgi:hypothetical protein